MLHQEPEYEEDDHGDNPSLLTQMGCMGRIRLDLACRMTFDVCFGRLEAGPTGRFCQASVLLSVNFSCFLIVCSLSKMFDLARLFGRVGSDFGGYQV